MFCTQCGTQNKDDARFCTSCGNELLTQARAGTQVEPERAQHVYRSREAGSGPVMSSSKTDKIPLLAAGLSFLLTGIGQFYNGDMKKGGLMLGGALLCLFVFPFLAIPIWLYSIYDAYTVADGKKALWN